MLNRVQSSVDFSIRSNGYEQGSMPVFLESSQSSGKSDLSYIGNTHYTLAVALAMPHRYEQTFTTGNWEHS